MKRTFYNLHIPLSLLYVHDKRGERQAVGIADVCAGEGLPGVSHALGSSDGGTREGDTLPLNAGRGGTEQAVRTGHLEGAGQLAVCRA